MTLPANDAKCGFGRLIDLVVMAVEEFTRLKALEAPAAAPALVKKSEAMTMAKGPPRRTSSSFRLLFYTSEVKLGHRGVPRAGNGMSDPVTIGALAASVLAMGADAVLKSAVGEAAKDAYKALKEKIAVWAGGEVATLEAAPSSKGKQLAVAEIIDEQSPLIETPFLRSPRRCWMLWKRANAAIRLALTLVEFMLGACVSARLR